MLRVQKDKMWLMWLLEGLALEAGRWDAAEGPGPAECAIFGCLVWGCLRGWSPLHVIVGQLAGLVWKGSS